jgi:type III secretion protein Q
MQRRHVAPYSTDSWPRWTRQSAALSKTVARAWFDRAPLGQSPLGAKLGAMLGGAAGVQIEHGFLSVRARSSVARAYASRPTVFALFSLPSVEQGAMCVAIDAPLARWISAKCSGASDEEAQRYLAPSPWTAAMEGSFALACIQGARHLCIPATPPLFRAATDRWDDVDAALAQGKLVVWPARVAVAGYGGSAALIVPASLARVSADAMLGAISPRVGSMRVRAALVCARASVSTEELSALSRGSLLVLGAPLERRADQTLAGPMTLSLGSVECPVYFDGALRCEGEPRSRVRAMSNDDRSHMNSNDPMDARANGGDAAGRTDASARTALLSTLPVEVEVVLARGSFAVAEVGAWRPGEVIALPTRVGSPVEIVAGDRLIARGELCDVEGEVGVRITELLG